MTSQGPDAKEEDPDVTGPDPVTTPFRKSLHRIKRVGLRVLAAGCLLGLLLLGALQSDRFSTWLVTQGAGRLNPYPGTQLTVERVSGSWIRSLRLQGVRLAPLEGGEPGGPEFTLDTLALRFRLFPLLVRRLEIRGAGVSGLRADLTQRPDSLWDLLLPFQGGDKPPGKEEGRGGFRIRTGPIRIQDSAVRLTFAPGSPAVAPDRLEVEELTLLLASLEAGNDGWTADLDTLYARFLPPGESFDRVFLEGKGSLADGRVEIPGLTLKSGLSDVSAQGTLLLPQGEDGEVDEIDFHFRANPLAFRDLAGFLRTLDPAVSAQADLRLRGRSSRVEVSGNGALSTGGNLELDGTFTPSATGPVEYRLRVAAQGLGLESFLGDGVFGGIVDGQVAVEMEGRDRAHLTGDLSARVEGLRIDGRGTRPLVVSGDFLDGETQLEVEAGRDGLGTVRLSVGGRPLDPDPTLQIQGSFHQDRSQTGAAEGFLERAGLRETEAHFALHTRGFSVDSSVAEMEVETRRGSYRELSLEGGTLKAFWNGGEGRFELSQPFETGRLAAHGDVAWREIPVAGGGTRRGLSYSLPDLELRELDLFRLLGDTVPSRVNARASLAGTGTDLATLQADARVQLLESEFRGMVVDSAVARPSLKAGGLSVFVEAWLNGSEEGGAILQEGTHSPDRGGGVFEEGGALSEEEGAPGKAPGGRLTANLQGRPFDAEPFLVLDSLLFSGLDLATITGLPSHLSGAAKGRMEGFDPRRGKISGRLSLSPSRVRNAAVDSVEVVLSLAEGGMDISGHLSSPEGTLRLKGSARPFEEPREFLLEQGEVRELNLGPLLGQERLQTRLNMDLDLSGSGPSFHELEALGGFVFLPSTLNQGRIQEGTFTLEAGGGSGSLRGQILTGEGEVNLTASASLLNGVDDLWAEADVNLPDLAGFLGWAGAEVEARGTTVVTWANGGPLAFASELQGQVRGAAIDSLTLLGSFAGSTLQLDTLRIRSEILEANGGGRFALRETPEGNDRSDLRVMATVLDLSPLGSFPGWPGLAARNGQGKLHVTGPAGTRFLTASLELGPWLVKNLAGDSARVVASYEPDGIALSLWAQAPRGRGSIDLALKADPGPDQKQGILERLDVVTPEARWGLEAVVPFAWKDGSRIDGFVLASDESRISVDGGIDPRGAQDLTLTLENARLFAIARLLGLEDLNLLADGRLDLTGPASSPRADGSVSLSLTVGGGASTSVETRFSLAEGELNLDAQATDRIGGRLILHGTLPLAFSLAPGKDTLSAQAESPPAPASSSQNSVDLTLRSEAFDISWARALFPGGTIAALEGVLSADARATGPFADPVLEGQIGLSGGMIRIPSLGTSFREISASADLRDHEILITRASTTSGSGTAEVQGSVALQGFELQELDLTARLDRFLAMNTPAVTATLTGGLSLRGSAGEPLLTGNLVLEGSKIGLDNVSSGSEVRAVELTEEDYQMLEDYFGYSPRRREAKPSELMNRLGMELSLSFDRDVWVTRSRKPRISVEVRGELDIEKDSMGELRAIGTVETLPERSYFREFGRRFSVQEGELILNGDPAQFSFRMDSQWEVPSHSNPEEAEVVINLLVEGDAESLELTLSSDPEMDDADIISYLAVGKPQSDLASSGNDAPDMSSLGASMAFGAVAGALEEFAGDAADLDVVEIRVDPVKGTTLIAGRYVSANLYLGLRQPVIFSESSRRDGSQNQNSEVELEYRWFPWLTLNFQGGSAERRVFLRARYAY